MLSDVLQPIFAHARTLGDDARRRFLDEVCGGSPDLRREIESLLTADEDVEAEADGFLCVPAIPPVDPVSDLAGREVGPYTLDRLIGRGGMGSVYLARRRDVGTQVALKVLDHACATPEASRRFLLERRVLAKLVHPHIARLLDAGVIVPATPYFVMEFVDGQPITNAATSLDLDARLRLFERVCAAVAYAHQHLVVHRDLKPSNVLVDRSGVVKLVDFGTAKPLDEHDELTGTGTRLMTPEFAAPEQVLGDPITPATDVYALGLLLFELLTGKRAYTLRGATSSQAERIVCEWTPTRPSIVAGRRNQRRIASDVDAICLKALEKDPERRYPTAAELRADLLRYLDNRPVDARTPTRMYVARKFVVRHRVALAAILVAILIVGSLAVVWQARRANRERVRAERALSESHVKIFFALGEESVAVLREG